MLTVAYSVTSKSPALIMLSKRKYHKNAHKWLKVEVEI